MWTLSTDAQLALVESHGMTARATVYSPTLGVLNLPIAGGQVDADPNSQVRRTGTVAADPRWWPRSPQDLLAPYGSEMQIDYGIVLRSGDIEWVPVMRGRLDDTQRKRPATGSGELTVKLVDRAAAVAEDRLLTSGQTRAGYSAPAEITRLIQETLGAGQVVDDRTGITDAAPVIDIPRDRWDEGVEKLATGIGAEVFFDQQGTAIIRPQPTLDDPEVWRIATGAAGTILSADDRLTRDGVYNRVVAIGQRSDGTPPVWAVAEDTDPASPTRVDGPFGPKPRFYSSAMFTTTEQCQAAADALLARVRGASVRTTLTTLVNPALEPGDVIVAADGLGRTLRIILDKITVPLSVTGTQPLQARSDQLPGEQ